MTHSKFPGLRWDAEGNTHHCATEDDVQPGWTDYHPDNAPKATQSEDDPWGKDTSMTRAEIIAALDEGGVAHKKNAPTDALAKQLRAAVLGVLEEGNAEYNPLLSTKNLLALIPAPE